MTNAADASAPVPTLVAAAQGQPVPHTPVWFMRQAGRSLPEYRRLREGKAMLEACRDTALCSEITLQPVRRHDVDAAIFFSDIVVPLQAVGVDLDIVPGTGPVVEQPFRTRADLDRLPELTPDMVTDITASVGEVRRALRPEQALIGFAGAPFTLASYLVEGGPSKNHENTKALMHGDPELWNALCERLAAIAGAFLQVQVDAGADAVQLFDSWVGYLNRADYSRFVAPHSAAALASVEGRVPRIHFGVGTGELLDLMGEAGAEVVGVDYRVDLADALQRTGGRYALQGNLDPALLFAPDEPLMARVDEIVEAGRRAPGHLFNLGHGVLPSTDPDVITRVTARVHEVSAR
ncbi:uroporphyrinogen decarboxylase [Kytococcus sp. Marseille-QA3725]